MNTFFDESGTLNIDDLIFGQSSFKKNMEDGVVTDEGLTEQKERVIAPLEEIGAKPLARADRLGKGVIG